MTKATIHTLLGNAGDVVRFTVGNAAAIEKGSLLWLDDNRTASGSTTATLDVPACGIAAEEKVAGDGATSIGVYTNGIFDIVTSDPHVAGAYMRISGAETVGSIDTVGALSGGHVFCKTLEDNTAGETVLCKLIGL